MAALKVTAQAIGGDPVTFEDVQTVGEVKRRMGLLNYTATVNGNPTGDDYRLTNYDYVSLAAPVKGGATA